MDIKPGAKTSEFYISLIGYVIGIAIMLGYITPEQGQSLTTDLKGFIDALEIAFGALLSIVSLLSYLYSRYKLKKAVIDAGTNSSTPLSTPTTAGTLPGKSSYIVE